MTALAGRPPRFTDEQAARLARDIFGIEGNPRLLYGERDQNFHIAVPSGQDILLKIVDSRENADVIDLQISALRHVIGKPEDAAHIGAVALLQLDLEAAGIADAADGRRRHRDDEGLLYLLQTAIEIADDGVGIVAFLQAVREGIEAREDDAGIRRIGEGGAREAGEVDRMTRAMMASSAPMI